MNIATSPGRSLPSILMLGSDPDTARPGPSAREDIGAAPQEGSDICGAADRSRPVIPPSSDADHFEEILKYLEQARDFDFTAYKRTSLMRRVVKRMHTIGIGSFPGYLDYLQVRNEEFAALFNTILINVTSFFRDAEVWGTLRDAIIPVLLKARKEGPIRVWSAGCASGQEPYSLAMLFAEAVGIDALHDRVKIYATDADQEALAEGRAAMYTPRQVADVPDALLAKYFVSAGGNFIVNRDLRRAVIFGRHDLLQDAPISMVDLLLCRNTLMYFTSEAQSRIVQQMYFSTNPAGYAVLGRTEMLFTHGSSFPPIDLKRRIFRSVPRTSARGRLLMMSNRGRDGGPEVAADARLPEVAFEDDSVAQLVLDPQGMLPAVNGPGRHQFHSTQGFETASGELQSTTEELETTNEELRSTVEELETTNEELRSVNEELETMNEKLQSTNEELQAMNDALRARAAN